MKPNILFIHTDSMDGRLLGCLGHPAMRGVTPHLDTLAANGTLFTNAYSNCPMCVPSRASMWTGKYPAHCEGWNNFKGLEPGQGTLLKEFENAGYDCRLHGKVDTQSGGHSLRARVSAWTRTAGIRRPNYNLKAPEIRETDECRVHGEDWRDVDQAADFLRQAATGGSGRPFLLYLGIRMPHSPFRTSRHYLNRISLESVDIPPYDHGAHPVMEHARINKNWGHGLDADSVRRVRAIYFAMIAEVDDMVGRVLAALRESGLEKETVVVFSSDHGELAMEHQQVFKMSPYEPSVRVPMIMSGPGIRNGVRTDTLVSLVDVLPTLLELAGIDLPGGLDGYSLRPELNGQVSTHPPYIMSEYHDSACIAGWFMIREGNWKYIAFPGHPSLLFDLARDPWEIHDESRTRLDQVARLDARLRSLIDCEEVERKVIAYDKACFREWRAEALARGAYRADMARIFSGYDGVDVKNAHPWSDENERAIESWLQAQTPPVNDICPTLKED